MGRVGVAAVAVLLLLVPAATPARAQAWARFRGPNGAGIGEAAALPVEFGPGLNVIWKIALPTGYSSPVITGDRIFVTAMKEDRLLTIGLSRTDGRILWEREAPRPRREKLDPRNHPAAPSAATDGERVVVFFADYGLLAYDIEGRELWRLPLGPFNNIYGMGASPILAGDLVVLVCDQSTGSFILAVDKRTGKTAWRTDRPEARSGHSTPILYEPADGPIQVLVPGSFQVTSFAIETGRKLWWVRGLSFEVKSVPVIDGDTLFINGYGAPENQPGRQVPVPPFAEMLAAYDEDRDGRLSKAELPDQRTQSYLEVIDLDRSGLVDDVEWNRYYASPVAGDGKIYLVSEKGLVAVLPPDGSLEPLVVNDLGEACYATPALVDGRIYLRTVSTLYAFGTK